jgi:hypothetical protein
MRWLCLLAACILLVGCGDTLRKSEKKTTTTTTEKGDVAYANYSSAKSDASKAASPAASAEQAATPENRKIIYTAEVRLVTDDFERAEVGVPKLIKEYGGYIAEGGVQRTYGDQRSGRWVARVPVDRFDAFLEALPTLGIPEHRSQRAQEVTEEFVDLQARIATTRKLEERILKLLEEQTGKIEEMLKVESELSRVRGEAERMEGRLRYLTDRTAMTTVTISAREEKDYVPPEAPEFGERITSGFSDSIDSLVQTGQDVTVGLVQAVPWILVGLVVIIPLAILAKRRWRARRGK